MGITQKQLERRQNYIGSSDIAPVLGLVTYGRTAMQVWLEKTGKVEMDIAITPEQEAGNIFEPSILNWFKGQVGPIIKNQRRVKREYHLAANIDAITMIGGIPVEAKTVGMGGGYYSALNSSWGEPGTNQVADHVLTQCHVHMICTDAEICHVPVFIGGRGFGLYHVELDKELKDIIIDKAIDFWENHVEKDIPPRDNTVSLAVAKRIIRTPKKIVPIPVDIYEEWDEAKKIANKWETVKEEATSQLLVALGDAEAGEVDGVGTITYFEESRKGYTVEPKKFRQLRFKKLK